MQNAAHFSSKFPVSAKLSPPGPKLVDADGSDFQVVGVSAAWRKLLGNLAANPITALTMRRIDVLRDPDVAALARRVLEEGLAVARADGAQLGPEDIEAELRMYARVNPGGGSSMLYDRLAGRPLEHEYIIGEVVRRAERHGIPVPLNRALLTLLRALAASVPPSSG